MAKKKSGAARKPSEQSDSPAPPLHDPIEKSARLHIWQIQAVRDVLLVAAIVGIFWTGYMLRAVTVPLLVALMLAYLFEPIIARLSLYPKMNRLRSVIALLGTVGMTVAIILAIVIPLIVSQSIQFKP
ncbi:MAG: hypothetical protein O7G85_00455 [Planctomycetota bacterium]|nr:hypothetical protein [Planctomycetota bacterium]